MKDIRAGIDEFGKSVFDHWEKKWYIIYHFNRFASFEARCLGWRTTRTMRTPSTDIFGPVEENNDENIEEDEEQEEEEEVEEEQEEEEPEEEPEEEGTSSSEEDEEADDDDESFPKNLVPLQAFKSSLQLTIWCSFSSVVRSGKKVKTVFGHFLSKIEVAIYF